MEVELCKRAFVYTQSCVEQAEVGRLSVFKIIYDDWWLDECVEAAADAGQVHILRYLWALDGEVINGDHEFNVLSAAAELGHLEMTEFVVEMGIDIHQYDEYMLFTAAAKGHLRVVEYILSLGPIDRCIGRSPIAEAAWQGHDEMVKFLCERTGGGLDAAVLPEFTPLHYAVKNRNVALVHYLLDNGYAWGAKYALIHAAKTRQQDIVRRLAYHPDVTEEDRAKAHKATKDPRIHACLLTRV